MGEGGRWRKRSGNDVAVSMVAPRDLEAERAVLGACIASEKALAVVIPELQAEDFYSDTHRAVYAAIRAAARDHRGQIDHVILNPYLAGDDLRDFVLRLVESMPTAANAGRYARIVREVADARHTLDALDAARASCLSEEYARAPQTALSLLEAVLKRDRASGGAEGFLRAADELSEDLARSREHEGITGVRTGIPKLDQGLKGLNAGRFYVVAGRPGMGKSLVCAQIALNAARQGKRVLLASPEMSRLDYLKRLACAAAGVDWGVVEEGQMSREAEAGIMREAFKIAALPFFVDDRGAQTVGDIRRNAMRHEPDLIMVDYLQRLTSDDPRASKYEQVSQLSYDLDSLKKDFSVPVVAAAQLSRAVEQRHDKHPMLSDLRESGQVEQDADAVIMLFRPHYYSEEAPEDVLEIHVEKNRHGKTFQTEQYLKPGAFWVVGARERGLSATAPVSYLEEGE